MPRRITHAEALIVSHPNFVVAMERKQAVVLAGLGATIEHVGDLLDSGVSERDIRLMIRDNPARLFGLD
jgi:hypothetical protein